MRRHSRLTRRRRGVNRLDDHQILKLQAGYDTVATEYVARIFDELKDKPLDRQLLDRFATRTRDAVRFATWAADRVMWPATCMNAASTSSAAICRPAWSNGHAT